MDALKSLDGATGEVYSSVKLAKPILLIKNFCEREFIILDQ